MEIKGKIFDIQSFSVHDGPGCRTNVFLTGCPLKCRWCANPESWILNEHVLFAQTVCKWKSGCRACKDRCPYHSISFNEQGEPSVDWNICKNCKTFECTKICPNNALKQCVRQLTVSELVAILRRDFNNWGPEGGVTFSGGDPMLQHDFLLAVLKECKKHQIHTAIETSACFPEEIFMEIMQYINFAFIDVKNMDDEKHIWGTGVSNKQTLSNISKLMQSGWQGRLVLRQPTICDYNDSIENAKKIIAFMKENDLYEINLLKFHRMGGTKWNQMGKEYEYAEKGHGDMTEEKMKELQQLYLNNMIACYIGDDTPF